jgi:hypothetical protein
MVKVGDLVHLKGTDGVGRVEAYAVREELRPYTSLVRFFDGYVGVYSDAELEVIE